VQPVWRWGLLCGALIVVIDTAARLAAAGQPETSLQAALAANIDLLANLILFSVCGYQVGRQTRMVRSAAEAGVTAGLLAGVAALVVGQLIPPAEASASMLVSVLALNVAMGGVLALSSGFLGSRVPQAKR
jgi:hypothetical protein